MIGDLHAIRTDVVGSLLRPTAWLEARDAISTPAQLSSHALQDIELACVRQLVALQEIVGLDVVTDGEIGRLNFQDSFGLAVSGFDAAPETLHVHQRRAAGGAPLRRWDIPDLAQTGTAVSHRRPAIAPLSLTNNVALAEYKRTSAVAEQAGEGQFDRTGSDPAAFRLPGVESGVSRFGRVLRRRGCS